MVSDCLHVSGRLRRAVCARVLLVVALFACGADPVAPTAEAPAVARWSGSYTGQSRFGGTNGVWGNGGTYPLVVHASGEVSVNGVTLIAASFNDITSTLRWSRLDGNATNGEVVFRSAQQSDFFFRDLPNATVGQNMTGWIQRAGEGRLDYRGVLR